MNYQFYPNNYPGNNFQQSNNYYQPNVQQDERIWVQGEAGANAYLVAPNSFVRLWDSQSQVFYEKRADASGRPFTEVYEYQRRSSQTPTVSVLDDEVNNSIKNDIKALTERVEALEIRSKEGKNNAKTKSNANDSEV